MNQERLAGRVCVVAGAGSVIGQSVADRLSREGATVVGIDLQKHSVGGLSYVADLSDEAQVKDVFRRIYGDSHRIDCLYNNAGYVTSEDKSVLETDSNVVEEIFKANFLTAWLCCKHGIPYMIKTQPSKSSVVNVSSFLSGMGSATGQMAYNAAKAAVAQFTRDLGTNLAKRGVRVNALALGPIETPQLAAVFTRIGEEERRRRFTHMPLGRFGTLEELAGTVAYLFSDDAGFVNGSVFPLDGGIQHAYIVPD